MGSFSELPDLIAVLGGKGLTVSLAESCTGGAISSMITSVPGASSFFLGSAVTYSDASKMSVLGVKRSTLTQHGAVSAAVAEEMAAGARSVFLSDLSASATGIAGPGGGSDLKPVGLVYIGVSSASGTRSVELMFEGSREDVRRRTAEAVIEALIQESER